MNLCRELDVVHVLGARMSAVEDPTTLKPNAIANSGPGEFRSCAPEAIIIVVDIHDAAVFPLDLHVGVMATGSCLSVRADLRLFQDANVAFEGTTKEVAQSRIDARQC